MTAGREDKIQQGDNKHSRLSAFTLIEVLLVVVIIGIMTGIALPAFVNSYRGVKMRTSVRAIVMASRYAHSVAVLNQVQTALYFDVAKGEFEVVSLNSANAISDKDRFLEGRNRMAEEGAEEAKYAIEQRLTRTLPEGIRIIAVESGQAAQEYDGVFWINYYPNGMCDDFSISLQDDLGKQLKIMVDPLSAKAKVKHGF